MIAFISVLKEKFVGCAVTIPVSLPRDHEMLKTRIQECEWVVWRWFGLRRRCNFGDVFVEDK
jgi:hypothetical protein